MKQLKKDIEVLEALVLVSRGRNKAYSELLSCDEEYSLERVLRLARCFLRDRYSPKRGFYDIERYYDDEINFDVVKSEKIHQRITKAKKDKNEADFR